jgi:hypothetical protein
MSQEALMRPMIPTWMERKRIPVMLALDLRTHTLKGQPKAVHWA